MNTVHHIRNQSCVTNEATIVLITGRSINSQAVEQIGDIRAYNN